MQPVAPSFFFLPDGKGDSRETERGANRERKRMGAWLEQELSKAGVSKLFSVKGQIVTVSVSVETTHLCRCSIKAAIDNAQP